MLRLVARVLWKRGAEIKAQAAAKATEDTPAAAAGNASLDDSMPHGRGEGSTPSYWHSFEAVAAMQGSAGIFSGVPRPAVMDLLNSLR